MHHASPIPLKALGLLYLWVLLTRNMIFNKALILAIFKNYGAVTLFKSCYNNIIYNLLPFFSIPCEILGILSPKILSHLIIFLTLESYFQVGTFYKFMLKFKNNVKIICEIVAVC